MTALVQIRATLLRVAFAAMALLVVGQAPAQSQTYLRLTESDALYNRPVYLGLNKSIVIELPRPAGDVLVSNPAIADAVLRTSQRLYLIGVRLGQANIFLFDSAGQQIASFDVYVEADLGTLNQLLAEAIPEGFVRADAVNGSIILRGEVPSATAAGRAVQLTESMMNARASSITNSSVDVSGASPTVSSSTQNLTGGPGIINLITIAGEEQVALKVTIAEVQRAVVKQLGINTEAILEDTLNFSFSNGINFPFTGGAGGGEATIGWENGSDSISATVEALEETRMLRTLAEPTLTAVSGETANFLAGGEFPIPVNADDGGITVEFKQFGVNLAFTPVVLAAGRISLKVRTEVSDLSAAGAVNLPIGGGDVVTIPGVSVRRAETTVELPSGGSFVIAGLVQEDTRRAASGLPWLQRIPILGMLFSSKDFLANQTELVMIVTPYLVKPTSPRELARPDQNLVMADDAEAYFRNRLTEVYGNASQVPAGAGGQVGFTFD
jgi:pilus assembly protein CpaC